MNTISGRLKTFALDNLTSFIQAEGKLVSDAEFKRRLIICESCEFYGEVEPLPALKTNGCTICGCPTVTKAYMKTMLRHKDKENEPLTIAEILELKTLGKFNKTNFFQETITCPHPKGNKWKNNDNKTN